MVSLKTLKNRSSRNMGAVRQDVKEKVMRLLELAYAEEIFVQISSGHRTFAEQARLFGQGRPNYYWNGEHYGRKGNIVTYAKPGQSNHHNGRAVDFFLVSPDGEKALWTVDAKWYHVAEIAKELGFSWGGDWKKFKDYAHLELLQESIPSEFFKVGSTGTGVKHIQRILAALGYSLGPSRIDGRFGPATLAAVKQFQRNEGLKVDGIAGPNTIEKLKERSYPGEWMRRGVQGNYVKKIQKVVGVGVDGIFGKKTEAAVKGYQRKNGLYEDGIVGSRTWRKMFGA